VRHAPCPAQVAIARQVAGALQGSERESRRAWRRA
jgi:hypothetical protein